VFTRELEATNSDPPIDGLANGTACRSHVSDPFVRSEIIFDAALGVARCRLPRSLTLINRVLWGSFVCFEMEALEHVMNDRCQHYARQHQEDYAR
jgi:hypothetical protein